MRVLEIVHGLPPAASGGAELYAALHARTLRAAGCEVVLFAREADPERAEFGLRRTELGGVATILVNQTFRSARSFAETYRAPGLLRRFLEVLDEVDPEIAHVHHLTCLSTGIVGALRERGIPVVATLHDYWLLCHRGQLLDVDLARCAGPAPARCARCIGPAGTRAAWPMRAIARRLPASWRGALARRAPASASVAAAEARAAEMADVLAKVDALLSPSVHLRDRFVAAGVRPGRIELSSYGIELERFRRATAGAGPLRIGFLGSLIVSKGAHVLLEAFSRLPPGSARLVLHGAFAPYHGDPSHRVELEPKLSRPDVRWTGALPAAEVPDALAELDLLVVPSIWEENSPIVVREAFAAGLPVVASALGGLPELVRDGVDGRLVPPEDPVALAAVLAELAAPDRRALDRLRAGIGAPRSIADDVEQARALYRRLLGARAGARPGRRRITALLLDYRTPDQSTIAARALLASRRPFDRIVLVDNDPAGAGRIAAERTGVDYLPNGANLGFAGGMNAGIREALAAGADAVLLVNSDAVLPPATLGRLENALDARPGTGLVAPVLLSRREPGRIASAGMSFAPASGRMRQIGSGRPLAEVEPPPWREVPAASGCVLLLTRELIERAGLLDESTFFTFEDLELGLRARRHGFAVGVVGDAFAYHDGSRSLGVHHPARYYYAARNHPRVAAAGVPLPALRSAMRTAAIFLLNVAHAVRSERSRAWKALAATCAGALDHVRGRKGPAPPSITSR